MLATEQDVCLIQISLKFTKRTITVAVPCSTMALFDVFLLHSGITLPYYVQLYDSGCANYAMAYWCIAAPCTQLITTIIYAVPCHIWVMRWFCPSMETPAPVLGDLNLPGLPGGELDNNLHPCIPLSLSLSFCPCPCPCFCPCSNDLVILPCGVVLFVKDRHNFHLPFPTLCKNCLQM